MTPTEFEAQVAQPNMQFALENPGDVRGIVNAILTLDALPGLLHACGVAAGDPAMARHKADNDYRDELAAVSRSYRVLGDTAVSLKHGELDRKRKKARLVRSGAAVQTVPNMCGLFQAGDMLGGEVVVIEFDPGPGYVRATNVIADSFRMLRRIVQGGASADGRT